MHVCHLEGKQSSSVDFDSIRKYSVLEDKYDEIIIAALMCPRHIALSLKQPQPALKRCSKRNNTSRLYTVSFFSILCATAQTECANNG